jgi:transcriptional regulator with XRE-family HTH domain
MAGLYRNAPLALNVRAKRVEHRLTQTALANRCGLSAETIRRIEQGITKRPRDPELQKIASVLDTTPEDLLGPNDGHGVADIPADDPESVLTDVTQNRRTA